MRPFALAYLLFILGIVAVIFVSGEEISLGTTLVALKFNEGVVVAADTRTSVSGYVSNKFAKKIDVVVDNGGTSCVICRSGSAADTQLLTREARYEFCSRYWQHRLHSPTISQVAAFLRHKMRSEAPASSSLQASLICTGYDESGGHIYAVAPGGAMWEEEFYCVSGSGSTMLTGYLDSLPWDQNRLNSEEEAIDLVTKLLDLSKSRDGSSGGMTRIVVLKQHGAREVTKVPDGLGRKHIPGFAEAAFHQTESRRR